MVCMHKKGTEMILYSFMVAIVAIVIIMNFDYLENAQITGHASAMQPCLSSRTAGIYDANQNNSSYHAAEYAANLNECLPS